MKQLGESLVKNLKESYRTQDQHDTKALYEDLVQDNKQEHSMDEIIENHLKTKLKSKSNANHKESKAYSGMNDPLNSEEEIIQNSIEISPVDSNMEKIDIDNVNLGFNK